MKACGLVLLLFLPTLPGAVRAAVPLRIAVAPFEAVSEPGQSVPDLAQRLAQRLATRGTARVVGPAELGASPGAEPDPSAASGLAKNVGVEALVVGRTTRIGRTLSVAARVLDGATGNPLGSPLVVDIAQPDQLGRAMDDLADGVIQQLGSGPPEVAAGSKAAGASGRNRFDSKEPISIQADELEHRTEAQRKYFVFSGNVHATQGELDLRSDRLEAFYPPGGSSPERLVATGSVRMNQGGDEAHCQKATFFRTQDRVVCVGSPAQLDRDCDRVRGDTITFHLDSDVLQVEGRADVDINSDDPRCKVSSAEGAP